MSTRKSPFTAIEIITDHSGLLRKVIYRSDFQILHSGGIFSKMKITGESHDYIIVIIKAVISVNLLDIQRNINMYYYRIETPLKDNPPFFFGFSNLLFSSLFQNTREDTFF